MASDRPRSWCDRRRMRRDRPAQDVPAPAPTALPSPFEPAPAAPPQSAPTTVEQLAARLRAMEEANKKLAEQLERTTHEHDAEMKELRTQYDELSSRLNESSNAAAPAAAGIGEPDLPPAGAQTRLRDSPVPDYQDGWAGPDDVPAPELPFTSFISGKNFPLQGSVGPGIGFQFKTPDDEFRLQLHYESQIEARIWDPSHQTSANSGIYLPRQRIFFRGNITKPVEYEISINRGLNNINLLNAYVNLHLDDRFEIRVGRYLTPLGYDQYAISNYWMPTPERSHLHDQRRSEPPDRRDGLGIPARQATRLRGRLFQRVTQLVQRLQQQQGLHRLCEREAHSSSRNRCRSSGF